VAALLIATEPPQTGLVVRPVETHLVTAKPMLDNRLGDKEAICPVTGPEIMASVTVQGVESARAIGPLAEGRTESETEISHAMVEETAMPLEAVRRASTGRTLERVATAALPAWVLVEEVGVEAEAVVVAAVAGGVGSVADPWRKSRECWDEINTGDSNSKRDFLDAGRTQVGVSHRARACHSPRTHCENGCGFSWRTYEGFRHSSASFRGVGKRRPEV
jgi:NADPH-dependent curcumin reductase CurA